MSIPQSDLQSTAACIRCESANTRQKGFAVWGDKSRRKFRCKDCNKQFTESAKLRPRQYTKDDYEQWEALKTQGKTFQQISDTAKVPEPTVTDYFRRKRLAEAKRETNAKLSVNSTSFGKYHAS